VQKTTVWLIAGNIVGLLCSVALFIWVYGLTQKIELLEYRAQAFNAEIGEKSEVSFNPWEVMSIRQNLDALRKDMAFSNMQQSGMSATRLSALESQLTRLESELGMGLSREFGERRVNCFKSRAGQISCREP